MKELIDKAALVTEIEKLKAYLQMPNAHLEAIQVCDNIISVIDTLEVKEVDLDLEITLWANAIPEIRLDDVERLAKYFYELGLKTKKKVE